MSCLETFATLRIFSKDIDPQRIESILGISPTLGRTIDSNSKYRNKREWNYWSWDTRNSVISTDNLQHIRAILDQLQGKSMALTELRNLGCQTDINCYWVSSGQGGPYLDVLTVQDLAKFELEVSWDMYFGDEAEYAKDDT